jgi:hypothetical protein
MASLIALREGQYPGRCGFRVKFRAGHSYGAAWFNYFFHFFGARLARIKNGGKRGRATIYASLQLIMGPQ